MEAGNYPVLTNRAPNSTKMSMDASMSNNDNTVQKNNIKNEKEKESKASTTRSSKRENTNTEEMAASTTKSSRRESENREESKASTTRSSKRENTNTEESAASTTKSSRRESENREESAASTTRSSRRENTDREDRSASTTSSLKRENEKREEGKAPNTTSPRKETDDREESAASTVRSSKRENTNREERKTPNTISARKETDNKEGNAASTTRSSRRENTNREESAASTTSSLRRENENREEGKAPNTTSPRKETDNREESADSTTRSSKKETTNREESAASTTRSSRRESENREEGKVPNTTSPRKKTDNREDGTAPNITSTRKETENREESAASTTRSSRRVSENREESTASTTRSSRRENEKREKSQKKNNKQQSKDEVRTLPKPPTNKQPRNSTLQIHVPGDIRSEGPIYLLESSIPDGQDPLSKDILPEIRSNTPQAQKNSTSKKWDKKTLVELRASSIIMGLKGIIMVAAIVLISSSEEISRATSCDLEKALKSISLNFTVSCEYDDIKKISTTLRDLGISLLTLNLLFFPLILAFMLLHKICKCLVCILFPFICIFSVFMIMEHDDILYSKTLQTDMNYVQLQSAMAIWLEAHYTSDNISSSDAISNSWNMFFIKYDCCAVNQVTGTTNDFDSTPWCTTAGSCQATASQIPKTCCIGVSEDDYGIAPSDCHSSVNSETFRSNCMNVIKQLSVVNVEECQLSRLQMSLIIIATLELVATAFEITAIIIWIILHKPKFIIKCIKFLCDKTKV